MTSDADLAKRTMHEIEKKLKKFQRLSKMRVDSPGSITPHQKRQIARLATQVGKLLKQIEALSPGFMEAFKGKLPNAAK